MSRRNKSTKQKFLFLLISIFAVATIIVFIKNNQKDKPYKVRIKECDFTENATAPIFPTRVLKDDNNAHLMHARRNGLKEPFASNDCFHEQIKTLEKTYELVEVKPNKYYQIKPLKHSFPYLVPEAVDLLNEIGWRFQQKLKENEYEKHAFMVTSLLRTQETQRKLSRSNVNATDTSAHFFGTTIDISYKEFYHSKSKEVVQDPKLVQFLTDVMTEMREECKLMVVRERKQACFHLTVVVCANPLDEKLTFR